MLKTGKEREYEKQKERESERWLQKKAAHLIFECICRSKGGFCSDVTKRSLQPTERTQSSPTNKREIREREREREREGERKREREMEREKETETERDLT